MNTSFVQPLHESCFNNLNVGGLYDKAVNQKSKENDKEKKGPITLDIDSEIDFVPTSESLLTTTDELCKMVNNLFHKIFSDYYGSSVVVNNNASISVNLVFKPNNLPDSGPEDLPCKAVTTLDRSVETTENDAINTMNEINMFSRMNKEKNNNFVLTSRGAGTIFGLLSKNVISNKMDCDNPLSLKSVTDEIYENKNTAWNRQEKTIYMRVFGIDIYKILSLIFGKKENGSRLVYEVVVKRPVVTTTPSPNGSGTNYIVEIQKMSLSSFEDAMIKMGMGPTKGSIPVVTGFYK